MVILLSWYCVVLPSRGWWGLKLTEVLKCWSAAGLGCGVLRYIRGKCYKIINNFHPHKKCNNLFYFLFFSLYSFQWSLPPTIPPSTYIYPHLAWQQHHLLSMAEILIYFPSLNLNWCCWLLAHIPRWARRDGSERVTEVNRWWWRGTQFFITLNYSFKMLNIHIASLIRIKCKSWIPPSFYNNLQMWMVFILYYVQIRNTETKQSVLETPIRSLFNRHFWIKAKVSQNELLSQQKVKVID